MTECPFHLEPSPGATGTLHIEAEPRESDNPGRACWRIRLIAGADGFSGHAALTVNLHAATAPWFLLPGFFYGQGRKNDHLPYPQLGEAGTDPWIAPSWDVALERLTMPLALVHLDDRWLGFDASPHYDIHPPQHNTPAAWGDDEPQIGLGFSWEGSNVTLRLNLPAIEQPVRLTGHTRNAPMAKRLNLPPCGELHLSLGWWDRPGDNHGYAPILHAVYAGLRGDHPPAPVRYPHAELADTAAHGLRAWHWVEDPGYMVYTTPFLRGAEFNSNNRGVSLGWHFEATGFVGGFPVAYGLLWHGTRHGNPESVRIAERLLTRLCRDATAPCGLFRTSFHPGSAHTPNGIFPNPAPVGAVNTDPTGTTPFYGSCWQPDQNHLHARTTADASLFLARCLHLLAPDHPSYAMWRGTLRRSLEAALATQLDDGRFGQILDSVSGAVVKEEGDGGLVWIPALFHAASLFPDDPDFQARLRAAMIRAGGGYQAHVEADWIAGAPEDVSLAPSSEDGYNAVMAYAALHRVDGETRWLDTLRRAADWTLTWRKAYNIRFHPRNILGAGEFRTSGGDLASCHNNHIHLYGLVCLEDLAYLSRVTGEAVYRERAEDHARFAFQLLCCVDGEWGGQRGMCDEQFYTTDWSMWRGWDPGEAHVQKGTIFGFSHSWCVNMILLGLSQIEGIDGWRASP